MTGKPGRSGGRNRKPAWLQKSEGNHGHSSWKPSDGRTEPSPPPEPSERLGNAGRALFMKIVDLNPHLTLADSELLERYVFAELRRRRAELDINVNGEYVDNRYHGRRKSPAVGILNQCTQELSRVGAALMLDTIGRVRLLDAQAGQPRRMTWQAFIEEDAMAALFALHDENWQPLSGAAMREKVLADHNVVIVDEKPVKRRNRKAKC